MAVVIRLARSGSHNCPKYRITVADSRFAAKKKFIEIIGYYNPNPRGQEKGLQIDLERAKNWIGKGAQPSPRVKKLMNQAGASD